MGSAICSPAWQPAVWQVHPGTWGEDGDRDGKVGEDLHNEMYDQVVALAERGRHQKSLTAGQ